MSTIFHRQALHKSGSLQPDLNGLNDIMFLLREKPMLQSDVLRPLLAKYLPFYTATDPMFNVNFRLQAQHWLVTNGDQWWELSSIAASSYTRTPPAECVLNVQFLTRKGMPTQRLRISFSLQNAYRFMFLVPSPTLSSVNWRMLVLKVTSRLVFPQVKPIRMLSTSLSRIGWGMAW
jgi:hypothetical protein